MPTAVPTMPSSLIGASKQRETPYFCWSPCVQRKTPPKKPTSSPKTTTSSSRPIETSMAERIASIIVILAIASDSDLLALAAQMRRQLGIDVLEDVTRRRLAARMQGAEALGLLLRGDDSGENL